MKFSDRAEQLLAGQSGTWTVHVKAQQRRAAGRDVILLTIGTPDQTPPAEAIAGTIKALQQGKVGYAPITGDMAVRQALAERIARRSGVACSAGNIAITPGAQGAAFFSMLAMAQQGDEVIVPEPMYAPYPSVVTASGARLVPVPTRADSGFQLDPAAIEAAITPQSRVVWINSPNNPTGAVYGAEAIQRLGKICQRHGLWLLSDEVYEDLAYGQRPLGIWSLQDLSTRVAIGSLSKSHAIPGFRLGWVAGPEALIERLQWLLLAGQYGAPPFIQQGALSTLQSSIDGNSAMAAIYAERAKAMVAALQLARGCRPIAPQGGMFVLLDIRGTGLSAQEFAEQLLMQQDVALLPCDGFGPSLAGHLRISLGAASEVLQKAANRIARFCDDIAVSGAK